MARKKVMVGIGIQIDENRKVHGFLDPDKESTQFEFWNGACRTTIQLSDDAFRAMVQVYAALQKREVERETRQEKRCAPARSGK